MADKIVKGYIGLFGGFTITFFLLTKLNVDFNIICNLCGKGVVLLFLLFLLYRLLVLLMNKKKETVYYKI